MHIRPVAGIGRTLPVRRRAAGASRIAHIAYRAGALDVDTGKLAISKSKNKDVQDLPCPWCASTRP